jgi:hypothetical protein
MIPTYTHALSDYLLPLGIAALSRNRRFGAPVRRLMTLGPIWHLGYALLTRYEGGAVPRISMRTHLALDNLSALSFVASGILMRRQPPGQRLLLAGIGLAEIALVARSSDRPRRYAR